MWLLHQFPLCPFSRKIRLLMSEKNIPFELVREDPWAASDMFFNLNPAGRTPVIVNPEKNITLADSRAIAEYFEETVERAPMIRSVPLTVRRKPERASCRRRSTPSSRAVLIAIDSTVKATVKRRFRRLPSASVISALMRRPRGVVRRRSR